MKEIELLFKIDETRAQNIREEIEDLFIKKIREIDTYFYPPDKDFLVSDSGRENLRVRESGDKKELTYKKVVYNSGEYSHAIEKNVDISDTKTTIEIFKTLGFREYMVVDKEREIFEDDSFQITIDQVKNLGIFVEIEWKGNGDNVEEIKKLCLKRAQELGLETIQDKGYLRLLEEKGK